MKERPILFSAPMVRAILSGAKTQTRRPAPVREPRPGVFEITRGVHLVGNEAAVREDWLKYMTNPYGMPGDRLWVRETWAHDAESLDDLRAMVEDIVMGSNCGPYYRADAVHENSGLTWRPSIHMPRWASRITLEITDVRVQRLQDISEDDAKAEGVDPYEWPGGPARPNAREAFRELWDRINGKRATWDSNPWVWVVSFQRVE